MATATKLALDYAAALTAKFADKETYKFASIHFSIIPGKKFDKLVQGPTADHHTSVAGFIDRSNGDLYKAAGWAAPAKHVRFAGENLMTSALAAADPFGGYLYL